jgi:hypothetical protein
VCSGIIYEPKNYYLLSEFSFAEVLILNIPIERKWRLVICNRGRMHLACVKTGLEPCIDSKGGKALIYVQLKGPKDCIQANCGLTTSTVA